MVSAFPDNVTMNNPQSVENHQISAFCGLFTVKQYHQNDNVRLWVSFTANQFEESSVK